MEPFEICRLTAIPNRRNFLSHVTNKSYINNYIYVSVCVRVCSLTYLHYIIRKYRYTGILFDGILSSDFFNTAHHYPNEMKAAVAI
jgi:hypothetical protein